MGSYELRFTNFEFKDADFKRRAPAKFFWILILTLNSQLATSDSLYAVSVNRVQVAPKRGVSIASIDMERIFEAYPGTKKAREELEKLILLKENEIAAKRAQIFKLNTDIEQIKARIEADRAAGRPNENPAYAAGSAAAQAPVFSTASMPAFGFENTSSYSTGPVAGLPSDFLVPGATALAESPSLGSKPAAGDAISDLEQKRLSLEEERVKKKGDLRRLERDAEKNLENLERSKTKSLLAKIYMSIRELAEEKNIDMLVDKNAILWGSANLDLTDDLLQKLKATMIEKE